MLNLRLISVKWWILVAILSLVLLSVILVISLMPIERYFNTVIVTDELDSSQFLLDPVSASQVKLGMAVTLKIQTTYHHGYVQSVEFNEAANKLAVRVSNLSVVLLPYTQVPARFLLGSTTALSTLLNL